MRSGRLSTFPLTDGSQSITSTKKLLPAARNQRECQTGVINGVHAGNLQTVVQANSIAAGASSPTFYRELFQYGRPVKRRSSTTAIMPPASLLDRRARAD